MKKFILIAYTPPEAAAKMARMTPEQKSAGMKPFLAWKEAMGEHLLDFGAPLINGTRLLADGSSK